jgi:hypothetical protein
MKFGSWFVLLAMIFIVLKVAEVGVAGDWSWWFVFSPILAYVALTILLFLLAVTGYVLKHYINAQKGEK